LLVSCIEPLLEMREPAAFVKCWVRGLLKYVRGLQDSAKSQALEPLPQLRPVPQPMLPNASSTSRPLPHLRSHPETQPGPPGLALGNMCVIQESYSRSFLLETLPSVPDHSVGVQA
jgi:hypothetical protein